MNQVKRCLSPSRDRERREAKRLSNATAYRKSWRNALTRSRSNHPRRRELLETAVKLCTAAVLCAKVHRRLGPGRPSYSRVTELLVPPVGRASSLQFLGDGSAKLPSVVRQPYSKIRLRRP